MLGILLTRINQLSLMDQDNIDLKITRLTQTFVLRRSSVKFALAVEAIQGPVSQNWCQRVDMDRNIHFRTSTPYSTAGVSFLQLIRSINDDLR